MPDVSAVTTGFGFTYDEPKTNELGQEAFLQLLTTQLQYQDPLNPQEDKEFIAQLAQFSSLEQLRSVNSNLDTIELYQISLNNSNALNLVGKEVNISDGYVEHSGDQEHTVNFEIPEGAEAITVTVTDEDGRVIREVDITDVEAGESDFTWLGVDDDGSAVEDGTYTIAVTARDAEANTANLRVYQRRRVEGLAYENGNIMLIIGDRKLPIDGVNEVYGSSSAGRDGSGLSFKSKFQPAYYQLAYGR